MQFLSLIDWSKVAEWTIPAILAFAFGYILQRLLINRQERFQKEMLERQLKFMERLERERAERDDKAEKARIAAEQAIAGRQNAVLQQISLNERNHETRLRSQDNWEARQRARVS
jgi:hypothetical protein